MITLPLDAIDRLLALAILMLVVRAVLVRGVTHTMLHAFNCWAVGLAAAIIMLSPGTYAHPSWTIFLAAVTLYLWDVVTKYVSHKKKELNNGAKP